MTAAELKCLDILNQEIKVGSFVVYATARARGLLFGKVLKIWQSSILSLPRWRIKVVGCYRGYYEVAGVLSYAETYVRTVRSILYDINRVMVVHPEKVPDDYMVLLDPIHK